MPVVYMTLEEAREVLAALEHGSIPVPLNVLDAFKSEIAKTERWKHEEEDSHQQAQLDLQPETTGTGETPGSNSEDL